MISIQTNVNSLVAQQNLSVTSAFQSKTIQQLTSGYRINSAGDDAAGLAVANKFRSSVAELTQGVANGNDAVAQLQIMDGGMSNISQILDRLKTLATQSASGTFTGNRATLNTEFQTDLAEIDRQAQSIGLDAGGTFAKNLSVYLGQGTGSGGAAGGSLALANASVSVDLSKSTVDSGSLGLKGLKAISGTIGDTGTDIGTGSSNGTTVADIVGSKAANAQAKVGYASFVLSGPGFSDSSKVAVSVNMTGVSDTNSLVTAINNALSTEAGGATQADQALKSAGITATVNTDQYGHQQLAFSSSTTAFQVQAGDQMANALMGNFDTPGSAKGKAVTASMSGDATALSTNSFDATNVSVQVSGAGMAAPVTIKLLSADHSVGAATSDLVNQVNHTKALQDAGITASLTDNKLQFTSATGATFNVSSVGDTKNALGLGTFVTTDALNGASSYSDITAASIAPATGNGISILAFSLNGGATGGITAGKVTGTANAAGTVSNSLGALGTMDLTLNGTTSVHVDFTTDANKSGTETVQKAADFINSQIQAQAGYGSDVKLASVDSVTNAIVLTGPADGAGSISASGAAATVLGLTQASGATIVNPSGSVGNTVSVNMAGGDASSAVATGSLVAPVNVATGTGVLKLKIDGVDVNADFTKDINGAGQAALATSSKLGVDASSTLNVSALQGGQASLSSGVLGSLGANTVLDLTAYQPGLATTTGSVVGGTAVNDASAFDLRGFAAQKADLTGASLGATNNAGLTALNLSQYAPKAAQVVSGSLGANLNSPIDLSQFKATAATVTGGLSLGAADGSTTLDFSSLNAQKATVTGDLVALTDTTAIAGLASGQLDGTTPSKQLVINGTAVDISARRNLDEVVLAINANGTLSPNILASDANGVLTIQNKAAGSANPITISANEASLAVGLSEVGQIADTTATGVGTKATMSGYSVAADATTAITGFAAAIPDGTAPNELQIGITLIDISGGAHTTTNIASLITSSAAGVNATANGDGTITLTNKNAGAGTIVVANNKAAQTIGFARAGDVTFSDPARWAQGTGAGELQLSIDGKSTINVDISGATNGTTLLSKINTALGNTQIGYGSTYNTAASLDTTGHLKFTSVNTGQTGASAGEVHVVQNAVSDSLGLTSGGQDTDKFGTDTTKLKLNIDGKGELDVNISTDTTVGQVAASINAALSGDARYTASYSSVASATTGSLVIDSVTKGTSGTVQVIDNLVSQKLLLTSSGDNNKQGTNADTLKLNLDGHGEVDVDISGKSDVDGVMLAINNALHGATAKGYDGAFAYAEYSSALAGSTVTGGITLRSFNTGATGASAGSIQVIQSNVSDALKLTAGSSVSTKGKDVQTLDLQMDGLAMLHIDLSTLNAATGKVSDIATAIQGRLTSDYGGSYVGKVTTANDGKITLAGVATGGSLTVVNNAVSQKLGLVSGTTADTVKSAADKTLNLQIDGKTQVDIDLSKIGASSGHPTLTELATAINSALVANNASGYGADYSSVAEANSDGSITLTGVQGAGNITVVNSTMSSKLSFTSTTGNASNTGTAAQTLDVSIDGKATTKVDFTGMAGGGTQTLSKIADAISTQLSAAYGAGYENLATANSDGTISIASKGTGFTGGTVTISNAVAGKLLGLTSGSASSITKNGTDETLADVVSFLNKTAQEALGTSTAAKIVTLDNSGALNIASQTKGLNSSVSVVGTGTTGTLATSLGLHDYVDSATTGSARSMQSVANSLKESFNGNDTLRAAGMTAQVDAGTGALQIKSSNGTEFRLDAWGTSTATTHADLGFGDTGKAFTNTLSPTKSNSSVIDTQGGSAIGTYANGAQNTTSISFKAMQFGNDDQSITISANSAAGVAQTPLTITLQNDNEAQTGASIDSAISAINTKLQQSENATLRSITAVAETDQNGVESLNFVSSLSSYSVSVGSSAGVAVHDGLNGGVAKTFSSTVNGASSSIAIDTQAGAQQALTALGAAVSKLGSAQATLGRGENQLTYAINLATSQITNFSAAESQIRDTNVAQQAANLSKAQTLSQASIAAMAQANSAPQAVLSLLRG